MTQKLERAALLARLAEPQTWDLAVIGGGATGLGVALDAVARGFTVVLLEAEDFAKGTSSRATKLVHGGVRYLAQGNVAPLDNTVPPVVDVGPALVVHEAGEAS